MSEMRKLMEAVEQLNEEYVEYRDPDGEFQVIYDFPRGYFAVGKNDAKQDISGESFDNLDDAIEHAEICLSISDDEGQPTEYEEWQDFQGGDDWDHGQYDESVEMIGEVSDFDGPVDKLIAQFEETCKELGIGSNPLKQKELLQVVMSRAEDTQDLSGLGHENVLGHDHQADFGGWPDKQR